MRDDVKKSILECVETPMASGEKLDELDRKIAGLDPADSKHYSESERLSIYLIDELRAFKRKKFDFTDWDDLFSEVLKVLPSLLKKNAQSNSSIAMAKALVGRFQERGEEFRKSGKYPWWYFTPEHGN